MDDIAIRPFREEDTSELIERIRELQTHELQFEPRMKHPDSIAQWYVDQMVKDCGKFGGEIFVAERSGELVGYACVFSQMLNDDPDEIEYKYAFVSELAVSPGERGKGLGTRLLDACREHAANYEVQYFRIGVLTGNEGARRLYQNYGFKPRTMELEMPL